MLALAQYTYFQGDEPLARQLFADGLVLYRGVDDALGQAFALSALGALAIDRKAFDVAIALLNQALDLTNGTNDPEVAASMAASTISNLAKAAHRQGDLAQAAEFAGQALERYRALGHVGGMISNLHLAANVAYDRGDDAAALGFYQAGLELAHPYGDLRWIHALLEGIAGIAAKTDQAEPAARLFAAAAAIRERAWFRIRTLDRPLSETERAAVRTALGQPAFAAAWAAGRDLPLDQAIAEALAIARPPAVVLTAPAAAPLPPAAVRAGLTRREVEVLRLLVERRTDGEMAATLSISPQTVATHVARIREKLGVHSRRAAAEIARRDDLV